MGESYIGADMVPAKPLKGVYTRFNAQNMEFPEPGTVRIRPSTAASALSGSCILLGVIMLMAGLPGPRILIAAGGLALLIGFMGHFSWSGETVLRLDSNHGLLYLEKSSFGRKGNNVAMKSSDVIGIRVLKFTIEQGTLGWQDTDSPVTGYELNLAIAGPAVKRIHLATYPTLSEALERAHLAAAALGIAVLPITEYRP